MDLVIARLGVSDDVAASKSGIGAPVEDPAREEHLPEQVRKQAGAAGVNRDAAVVFFRDQIAASKVVQKGGDRFGVRSTEVTDSHGVSSRPLARAPAASLAPPPAPG